MTYPQTRHLSDQPSTKDTEIHKSHQVITLEKDFFEYWSISEITETVRKDGDDEWQKQLKDKTYNYHVKFLKRNIEGVDCFWANYQQVWQVSIIGIPVNESWLVVNFSEEKEARDFHKWIWDWIYEG